MRSAVIISFVLLAFAGVAQAQQICTEDLDGSGALDDPSESRACAAFGGLFHCPIRAAACVDPGSGVMTCPTNPSLACNDDGSGVQMCSPNSCFDPTLTGGIVTTPAPSTPTPAPVDATAGCLGQLRIFSGYSLRCRRSGTQTVFQNCCSEGEPKSLRDTMGEVGERAAQGDYVALIGVGASLAVSAGSTVASDYLAATFDPTTLTLGTTMFLLDKVIGNQCDSQDVQTATLRTSGYCIDLGTYCAEDWPLVGCVQRAMSTCCFNSVLARIIQQQGRLQIPSMGGFGTPEAPNCRGFTPDEFRSLDFSKIDLSEYANEIRHRTQATMQSEVQGQSTIRLTPR